MPALSSGTCIEVCNQLLQVELSAVETYRQALLRDRRDVARVTLEELHRNHITSANHLREVVTDLGAEACNETGAWGAFPDVVKGAAYLVHRDTVRPALRQGERDGCRAYEDALRQPGLAPDCAHFILLELQPRQRRNLETITGRVIDH